MASTDGHKWFSPNRKFYCHGTTGAAQSLCPLYRQPLHIIGILLGQLSTLDRGRNSQPHLLQQPPTERLQRRNPCPVSSSEWAAAIRGREGKSPGLSPPCPDWVLPGGGPSQGMEICECGSHPGVGVRNAWHLWCWINKFCWFMPNQFLPISNGQVFLQSPI